MDSLSDEVGELNRILVRFNLLDSAKTLQADMASLLLLVDGGVDRIWVEQKAEDAEAFGPEATVADIVNKATGNSSGASPICYALLGNLLYYIYSHSAFNSYFINLF